MREVAGGLVPVDSVEIQVVVDNVTDSLSSILRGVTNENEVLRRHGMKTMSGAAKCCAHHGLALAVTARTGGDARTLLFDAGPEAYTFQRNAARLGVAFADVDAVVLSHGHWDHGGGLLEAVRLVHAARAGRPFECHVNAGMFAPRANSYGDGSVVPYEELPDVDALAAAGATVVCAPEARLVGGGAFYLSGEIPRVTAYERGLPGHVRRSADGAGWEPDPWLLDERYVALHVRGKGVVVLTACSHAGVVNVLTDARSVFGDLPLHAVMGGLHLSGGQIEPIIPDTVRDLAGFGLAKIVPAHCTGWRAVHALVQRFGEAVVMPAAVGRLFAF
jgi:7,8-dihydropterin-6-yl-methyl-4-(beta-D-ribofuranosyl)aminobenzene 5'-phosphate synthase